MSPKEEFYERQAKSIIDRLKLRGMEGYYCATKEQAREKALSFLSKDVVSSWGGSMTLETMELQKHIKEAGYPVYDRADAKTPEEKRAMFGKIVTADYYFMSANAITLDGELVNIDGSGNRVACLCHGPEYVIVIVGMNKVVTDVKEAIHRVHNMAAPPNARRLHLNTPCAETGKCADCMSADCICAETVITRYSRVKGRIKVILVGEELGY